MIHDATDWLLGGTVLSVIPVPYPLDFDYVEPPADATDTCVRLERDGTWAVCWWRWGHVAEAFGPAFASAGEAIAVSRAVRERLGLG